MKSTTKTLKTTIGTLNTWTPLNNVIVQDIVATVIFDEDGLVETTWEVVSEHTSAQIDDWDSFFGQWDRNTDIDDENIEEWDNFKP